MTKKIYSFEEGTCSSLSTLIKALEADRFFKKGRSLDVCALDLVVQLVV
jgi:hypothetical protein